MIRDGSGRNMSGSFATYDLASSLWKTSQASYTGEPETYSAAWPRSGMTSNGIALARSTSELRIAAIGYGSSGSANGQRWPTPTATQFGGAAPEVWRARRKRERAKGRNGNGFGLTLDKAVQDRLYPTPIGNDAKGGRKSSHGRPDGLRSKVDPRIWPTPRATASEGRTWRGTPEKLWPTPRFSEYKGTGPLGSKSQAHRLDRGYLDATVQDSEQETGPLNPDWVEWLMGFPIGWTDLTVDDEDLVAYGWETDPADAGLMPRLRKGVDRRADRLKALGNAVVPEIPARLGVYLLYLVEQTGEGGRID